MAYSQTSASAPGWWQPRCRQCGWHGEPVGDEASAYDAADEHRCPVPVGTGYLDAYGNVWVYNDGGHTVIDGKLVRGRPGRRMLAPGEVYYDTHGERRTVAS
jgi:hypothetical protein